MPVRVKHFSMWETSISMIWGKTPKVFMVCGSCSYSFSQRFSPIDFKSGHPKVLCPNCQTVNYVPIYVKPTDR